MNSVASHGAHHSSKALKRGEVKALQQTLVENAIANRTSSGLITPLNISNVAWCGGVEIARLRNRSQLSIGVWYSNVRSVVIQSQRNNTTIEGLFGTVKLVRRVNTLRISTIRV